ncbi:MAG: cytochrome C [Acidobacteria bacterium]|nr:MAG: cytochrome C [Acidobacteriota bacterium]
MKRAVIVIFILTIAACEREERGFRVQTPDANRINSKQLTTLQPGENTPTPVMENEYEKNAFAMSEGKRLFSQMNCVGCHANGGGGIGPALMDDKWIYGSQPDQIFATVVEGRPNGMPAFHGKIPDYQVWQIAAYVRSLSGNASKNAAPGRSDDMQTKEPENSKKQEIPKNLNAPK